MPNWCQNDVIFEGKKDTISRLNKDITSPVKIVTPHEGWLCTLSFDQPPWEYGEEFSSDLYPGECVMARTMGNVIEKSNLSYDKMIDVLGTKWDFSLEGIEVTDTQITGYSSTAWSPPQGWFRKVCEKYEVNGELRSSEIGNDFGCILVIDDAGERHYSSSYNEFECLRYDDYEEFLERLIDDPSDYPEFVESIKSQARGWPKTWSEYKQRFKV